MEEVLHFQKRRKCSEAFSWILIIGAILSLIAIVVCLVMLGLRAESSTTLNIISLSCLGGVLLLGGSGFLVYRHTDTLLKREHDAVERADSEDSFLVGDGTLATFYSGKVVIHRAGTPQKGDRPIQIPLCELRAFSVCNRRKPREKGEWSVVFEVPARDLMRDKSKVEAGEKCYIQTDAKERLYKCLNQYGIELLGERKNEEQADKKFTRTLRRIKPDAQKRRNALIVMIAGAVALIGGIVLAFLVNVTIGSLLAVFGAYFALRALDRFLKAKSSFSVYEEGIFWQETNAVNNIFLKWEEIERIERREEQIPVLYVQCVCGAYHLPELDGIYDEIKRVRSEKCA